MRIRPAGPAPRPLSEQKHAGYVPILHKRSYRLAVKTVATFPEHRPELLADEWLSRACRGTRDRRRSLPGRGEEVKYLGVVVMGREEGERLRRYFPSVRRGAPAAGYVDSNSGDRGPRRPLRGLSELTHAG
jgi:hypothetical protein